MPHNQVDGQNYVPHRELVVFASNTIIHHMSQRLVPILFERDIDSTRQAIAELLEHEDMSQFRLQQAYEMANELISDWQENQEELNDDFDQRLAAAYGDNDV